VYRSPVSTSVTEPDRANRELVERFFAASERGDRDDMTALTDEDMVMEWPQSGERFRGRDNVLAAMAAVEVKPEFAGQPRLIGSGVVWVLMVPLRYAHELFHYVAVVELEDGRVKHATGYWGAPFPAQAARARFTDDER
jgi:SnoaL-like domain